LLEVCLSLGHYAVKLDRLEESAKYYREALDYLSSTELGSHRHLVIIQLLAEAEVSIGHLGEAVTLYDMVFAKQRDGIFKETLLSLTVTEKYEFNKRLGELYEQSNRLMEASSAYESAFLVLRDNPDLEASLTLELEALSAVIFTANACGNFEKAFSYNKELHQLNIQIDPKHPNTLNSCISSLKLVMKLKNILVTDQLSFRHARLHELADIVTANCEHETELFKSYLDKNRDFLERELQTYIGGEALAFGSLTLLASQMQKLKRALEAERVQTKKAAKRRKRHA